MVFTAKLTGQYSWELFLDVDNSSGSDVLRKEAELESEVVISYEELVRALESSPEGADLGLDIGGIVDVTSIQVKGELDPGVKSEYEKIPETKSFRKSTKKTHSAKVGAGSSLKLYQLIFKGPGITYKTERVGSSGSTVIPHIPIHIKGELVPILKNIEVLYTSDNEPRPEGIIEEGRGHDPDINGGRKGKHVWLRVLWTHKAADGATGIQLVVGGKKEEDHVNLDAEDGDFRYLKMERDPESKHRITEVALWRRQGGSDSDDWPKPGGQWKCKTADINEGREGGELYVVWNGREIK